MVPDPADLPKEAWPRSLAGMGRYLGLQASILPEYTKSEPTDGALFDREYHLLTDLEGNEFSLGVFKEIVLPQPLISESDWLLIRDYYMENAVPAAEMTLPQREHPVLKGFIPTTPTLEIEPNGITMSTLVDEDRQRMYVGRGKSLRSTEKRDLLALDLKTGKRIDHRFLETETISLHLTETGIRMSTYGEFPVEPGNGQSYIADLDGFGEDGQETRERMLVNGLHRIVQMHTHDMDGDGLDDIVATQMGDGLAQSHGGALSIYWQTPEFTRLWQDAPAEVPAMLEGALRETVLINQVGMISSAIADFNNDGKPDIVALGAQAFQEVILFINQGSGSFTKKIVAQYTPSFGGNALYAEDMDGDGQTDIVVTHGDFVTLLPMGGVSNLKPFHGLRILRNDGDLAFTESYFYPMHGALKATVTDFDNDGDMDIAAIALYPNWDHEVPNTFVYLENQGGFEFEPASLPLENFGLWVSVNTADVNGDEKPDIVLGLGYWSDFIPDDLIDRPIMEVYNEKIPSIVFLINDH